MYLVRALLLGKNCGQQQNDLYFNLNTGNEEMSQNEISKYLLRIIRLS